MLWGVFLEKFHLYSPIHIIQINHKLLKIGCAYQKMVANIKKRLVNKNFIKML